MERLVLQGTRVPVVASPNHTPRPAGVAPQVIVLHSTNGTYRGALRWLCHPASGVSAHFLVGRDGAVVQLVPLERVAWHAGVSHWRGRQHVNGFSIGIEMEHMDRKEDWPAAQVAAVSALCHVLMARYGIPAQQIVSHAEVARPHGRKIDPVAFPWAAFRDQLRGEG